MNIGRQSGVGAIPRLSSSWFAWSMRCDATKRSAGGGDADLAQPGMETETLALGWRPRGPDGEEPIRAPSIRANNSAGD